ncbi:hypothetical protein F5877DRAFT_41611, partial [Lentinula edodes]
YLPFRRISLPSLPPSQSIQHSPLRRQTTQPLQPQRSSIASFDSFPAIEERERRESNSTARNHLTDSRPPSISPMRRKSRGLSVLPLDDPLLVKRRKVMIEFYETEKAYVEGLDLIYEHFLLPILNSLDRPTPILERPLLTAVFSNFVDIWNLHHSFYSELTRLFYASEPKLFPSSPPPLSPVLLTHFPYLSLYTPFITAFPQILSALNTLLTPTHYYRQRAQAQTHFVATQEKHPRCGKLQLRDWLLTIVQRCPRYLLLLRDLLSCTPGEAPLPEEGKEGLLSISFTVTNSLNTSIWSHSQTLALLALQRSTPNLPLDEFQFISPGRILLKRGTLLQVENPDARVRRGESKDGDMRPREREFLLFSDCLVWLANEEAEKKEKEWNFELDLGSIWSSFMGSGTSSTRSKSEAELPALQGKAAVPSTSHDSPPSSAQTQSALADSSTSPGYGGMDQDQWLYKGRIELVNLEIVVDTSFTVEDELEELGSDTLNEIKWRWEVLSPEGSFVLYAASVQERTEWTTLIRKAKSQQLVALNAQHPNSTLTSSEATQHIRRALQALPFAPNDGKERLNSSKKHRKSRSKDQKVSNPDWHKERRLKVEHWVPAIWIPDEKAEGCMRCGRIFGWRRRRHHCRLCGRCTFYITDPNINDDDAFSKSARACNACYESVFPLIDHHSDPENKADDSTVHTITSLSHLPSWMTMSVPSLALSSSSNNIGGGARIKSKGKELSGPEALMAIDSKRYGYDLEARRQSDNLGENRSRRDSGVVFDLDSSTDDIASLLYNASLAERREDTVRRNKRFSMPAVALQTTSVVARTQSMSPETSGMVSREKSVAFVDSGSPLGRDQDGKRVTGNKIGDLLPGMSGTRSKRFSLVLGGRLGHSTGIHTGGRNDHASPSSRLKGGGDAKKTQEGSDLGKGVAASRLNELLGRSKHSE